MLVGACVPQTLCRNGALLLPVPSVFGQGQAGPVKSSSNQSKLHLFSLPMGSGGVIWEIPHPVPVLGALAELGLASR